MRRNRWCRQAACIACLCSLAPLADAAELSACPSSADLGPVASPAFSGPLNEVTVEGDRVEVEGDSLVYSGNVEMRAQDKTVFADTIRYNRATDEIQAEGHVLVTDTGGNAVAAEFLRMQREAQTGVTDAVSFKLGRGTARGDAQRVEFAGRDRSKLTVARYTNCPTGQDDWFLVASKIDLDYGAEVGSATNARINFMGVPIFYWPYLTFPLSDKRKSGFLPPRFGNDKTSGFFFAAPYYLDLAPNYDATVQPRHLTQRGLQWQNEFRFLGENSNGTLQYDVLPDDRVYGDDRNFASFKHQYTISREWASDINVNSVSDRDYFSDFGVSLADASQTHLPQKLELQYRDATWQALGRLFDYQTIDQSPASSDPYNRLPQILFTGDWPALAGGLSYRLDGEIANFDHEARVSGQRVDLYPQISWPWRNSYSFVTPRAGYRYTAYALNEGDNRNPDRGVPVLTLDSGLFFERAQPIGTRRHTMTLEPRLFYLHVPYVYQDDLPIFDTALPDFNFFNLFRDNRFFGGDRVGDAEQATAAVTSRLLSEDGVEWFRISLGQVYYFADQGVQLGTGIAPGRKSDIATEVQARISPYWYVRHNLQWTPDDRFTRKGNVSLHYRPNSREIVNFAHRYIRDVQELIEVSTQWNLSERWAVLAEYNRSLATDQVQQSAFGVQYNACCWVGRLYGVEFLDQAKQKQNRITFEFELSGLVKIGQPAISPLRRGAFIFGK